MLDVIYEDNYIFVLNKPEGIVSNKTKTSDELSLQEQVAKSEKFSPLFVKNKTNTVSVANGEVDQVGRRGDGGEGNVEKKKYEGGLGDDFYSRNGLVHRLDKDTSGVLLFAKDPKTFKFLQKQFKNRKVKKVYIALILGDLKEERVEIDAPLGRNPYAKNKMAIIETGRPSLTVIEKIKTVSTEDGLFTLIRAKPVTGRTHQIRVHLTALDHPIVGDDVYAGRKRSKITRDKYGRLMLHAYKLTVSHPETKKKISFEAPIPEILSY